MNDDDAAAAARRRALLNLAAKVGAAADDTEALRIMQAATGLGMTDPAADRAELDRRVRWFHAAREGRLVRSLRCPACGHLPIGIITASQAICGTDGCDAVFYNPLRTAEDQLADRHEISLEQIAEDAPGGVELPEPPRPPELGSPQEAAAEIEARASFHDRGYVCADGGCAVCGPRPRGVKDGE